MHLAPKEGVSSPLSTVGTVSDRPNCSVLAWIRALLIAIVEAGVAVSSEVELNYIMDHVPSTLGHARDLRAIPPLPPEALSTAIDEFLAELKQKYKENTENPFLQALINSRVGTLRTENGLSQSEVSAEELHKSILELDARKRTKRSYRLLHRLSPFLEVLKGVLKKCEIFVQAAPFGVAIAFTGARIVLEMALTVEEYLEAVVTAMERIAGILEVYQKLSSLDLGPRLIRSYKQIITFWYKLSKILSSSKVKGILSRSILTPLKQETEDGLKTLQEDMHINLGITQAAGLMMADKDRQARMDADQKALKTDIRHWIMGENRIDFKGDYETQLDLRHEDTCNWILQDERFLNWHDSRNNALLWYSAPPGSGKSVLASAVIDYLTKAERKVAYFFYSFSKNDCRRVGQGLRILALQLLAFVGTPSDKLVNLYETETQFSPHLDNIRAMASVVQELITRNDDLYIVIDGIDECEDEKEMSNVIRLLVDQPTLGTVRWLFTSRVSEIEKTMRSLQAVEIHPSQDDIREDIKSYLSSKISCKHCLREWTDECDNNFLIARFVSETLGKLTSEADIEAELTTFPKKLNGYYMRTLAKINTRGQMEQLVARRIFLILSSAHQAVSIDELVDALAIQRGSKDYSASRLPKEELIRDLCGSLIVVEQHTSEPSRSPWVKFCHKSVKDFFQQDPKTEDLGVDESLYKYFVTPFDANEEIGLDCLTTIPKEHAFLRYAATFWFQHLGDDSIETPSAAAEQAVREFISSKNFWNCLRVQSRVVPYLFGRFTRHKRSFRMTIRGREWKGEDSFAVPLPTWLGDHSGEDLLRDQSLCHFAEEWREVIITHPSGLDQCVPTKPFANSCWLKSLAKNNTVKSVNLAEVLGGDVLTSSRLLGVGFSGKKLCVDVAYQTKNGPTDTIYHLRYPLFKTNSQPQKSYQRLPMDSDSSEWAIFPIEKDDTASELVAWSVDPWSLDLKKTSRECSERIKPPSLPIDATRAVSKARWEMLAHYSETSHEAKEAVCVIHVSRNSSRLMRASYGDDDCDSDSDDGDGNKNPHKSSGAESDTEGSDNEEEGFSDDDTSSEKSSDESIVGETTTDESDLDSNSGGQDDTDCLILIPKNHPPFWTKPWTHPSLLWSRIVCAVHPTRPLLVFMRTPTRLDVVDLEKRTEISIEVSGLTSEQEDILASAQELRFSRCGSYIHCLTIVFAQKNLYTECTVTSSRLGFASEDGDVTKTSTASRIRRVVYSFADPMMVIEPPFSLSYWTDDYIVIALPPLTCNPMILKIPLNGDVCDPVLTLRNQIYFPASTPRRDAHLVYRPNGKDSEGYVFLVLNAVPVARDAAADTSCPVVALRWGVSDDGGWRPWTRDDENPPEVTRSSLLWNQMRGNFVESGKPFNLSSEDTGLYEKKQKVGNTCN
ncbi:hypothetical protein O1611_g8142 [Lasiodiplodia mahajangana]|uniref:Uncharacterized protein n=1 Tax=Lasiodiplodia mahajangana TaxID=1108764 RepID=A0ACC2JD95_9PEZI|nr:hypothetical protein O1611_g8142 [Lasiodiplodia mahajangana]